MTHTPWGASQYTKNYCRGINFYSTSRHGGFKVSPTVNDKIHEAYRNADGWYEEDCEAAKVIHSFPELFTPEQIEGAEKTIKNYFWKEYEEVNGCEIPLEDSREKAKETFYKENIDKLFVISASGEWHETVPQNHVGVIFTDSKRSKEHHCIITQELYDTRHENPTGQFFATQQFVAESPEWEKGHTKGL